MYKYFEYCRRYATTLTKTFLYFQFFWYKCSYFYFKYNIFIQVFMALITILFIFMSSSASHSFSFHDFSIVLVKCTPCPLFSISCYIQIHDLLQTRSLPGSQYFCLYNCLPNNIWLCFHVIVYSLLRFLSFILFSLDRYQSNFPCFFSI